MVTTHAARRQACFDAMAAEVGLRYARGRIV